MCNKCRGFITSRQQRQRRSRRSGLKKWARATPPPPSYLLLASPSHPTTSLRSTLSIIFAFHVHTFDLQFTSPLCCAFFYNLKLAISFMNILKKEAYTAFNLTFYELHFSGENLKQNVNNTWPLILETCRISSSRWNFFSPIIQLFNNLKNRIGFGVLHKLEYFKGIKVNIYE